MIHASKNATFLEKYGWRLIERKRQGMMKIIVWSHPKLGRHTQGEAVSLQRLVNKSNSPTPVNSAHIWEQL